MYIQVIYKIFLRTCCWCINLSPMHFKFRNINLKNADIYRQIYFMKKLCYILLLCCFTNAAMAQKDH